MQLAKITLEELEILISNGYNVSINTKSGIEKITDTYRKITTGRIITFADGSSIKCADKHLMWQDGWYYAKDFNIGDKIGEHQIVNIIELDSQCWIDFTVDAEHSSYIHNNITHHNSGKSFIIYLTLKHIKERTLIIVPTISLVHQLANDFIEYDPKSANWIHKIMAGADKNIKAPLTISTWQSLVNQPQQWFDQFKVVIGDECLTPDTLITMSDGNKKRIDQVIIGDAVKTYNEKLHIIEDKLVKGIHKNISKKESMYELTLSNGNIIKITGNHKVLLTNGKWKRVDNLEVSDIINSIIEEGLKVISIKKIEYDDDVYNLHIEDNHNYFANDINVSNCHSFQATALTKIMEKCKNIEWKIGTTGTLSNADAKVNALILEGLFGEVLPVSTTRTLIDEDHLADFRVEALLLKYSKEEAKEVRKMNYYNEMTHINTSEKRNKFIANLAISQKNNTLVLFSWVEKHGKPLFELIKEKAGSTKNVYFISGEVKGEERERIRKIVNASEDNIIVASFQTFSTGIDLPNLHSVIFASSYKSTIKNLQSIGRVLRKHKGKEWATLYDIVDDCSTKTSKNFSVQHFLERVKIYNEAKFPFRIHNIPF